MRDRPEIDGEEIEITSEMIEVGADVLIESGMLRYDERGPVKTLVKDVLVACLSRAISERNR